MPKDKIRLFYILSLLILGSIIVLFAQGVLSGLSESSSKPVAEITRIDMYDDLYGNYSKISVFLANNDTISHNFSINTYYAEELKHSLNVTVKKSKTFFYQRDVLPNEIPVSKNQTINSTLRVAKFVVYMDDKPEPFEEAFFVFNNE